MKFQTSNSEFDVYSGDVVEVETISFDQDDVAYGVDIYVLSIKPTISFSSQGYNKDATIQLITTINPQPIQMQFRMKIKRRGIYIIVQNVSFSKTLYSDIRQRSVYSDWSTSTLQNLDGIQFKWIQRWQTDFWKTFWYLVEQSLNCVRGAIGEGRF